MGIDPLGALKPTFDFLTGGLKKVTGGAKGLFPAQQGAAPPAPPPLTQTTPGAAGQVRPQIAQQQVTVTSPVLSRGASSALGNAQQPIQQGAVGLPGILQNTLLSMILSGSLPSMLTNTPIGQFIASGGQAQQELGAIQVPQPTAPQVQLSQITLPQIMSVNEQRGLQTPRIGV